MEILLKKLIEVEFTNRLCQNGIHKFNPNSKIIYNDGDAFFLHEETDGLNYTYTMPYIFKSIVDKSDKQICREYIDIIINLNK